MRTYRADLHIHSVLSPCGGLEMSPGAVVARAKALGLDWIAITDHNSMANCPAYGKVARDAGLAFSWGVEVQSAEEIHFLVYFDDIDAASDFDHELYNSLIPMENDVDFFGDQVVIDENEDIIRMENRALANSSLWDISELYDHAVSYGGFVMPAHVDASANSIISQLGFMPDDPVFDAYGLTARCDALKWISRQPFFAGKALIRSSDAHYLDDLGSGYSLIRVAEPTVKELRQAALGLEERRIEI
ncbi:MAG TPA: PHP domain-containing protein [Candidatus Cloacimonadota bacterium]|nr:PHP domain-containing protein [Candidatus Cloacimonadota bacterium]HPS39034.1 PHP domain-containing protein [Candidatus Cloacimonadota bacterium]